MRVAVFSDIHGNAVALDAMLADHARQGSDALVCLGDAVQGGPQPAEVIDRLRALRCPVVMGNADAFLLDDAPPAASEGDEAFRTELSAVRAWTVGQIGPTGLDFIRTFPPRIERELTGGRRLLGYHGTPSSFLDQVVPATPEDEARAMLALAPDTIGCGGHTHVQFIRHFDRTFHFNPGSVGFAYRHHQPPDRFRADPWAEYALLTVDGETLSLEFRRVPFDADQLIGVYRSSGRPFAERSIRRYQD